MASTMTHDVEVLAAEESLRDLLRDGKASAEALREADEALQKAREQRDAAVRRAKTRQAMQRALDDEARAREQARREVDVADALAALADEAPQVTIQYAGLVVTIKLAGGLDHVARQVCLEGVARAVYTIDHRFSDRLIATRNALMSGQVPGGESFNVTFIDNLRDELRHAMRHGGVQMEM